jgi:hypothetical protein
VYAVRGQFQAVYSLFTIEIAQKSADMLFLPIYSHLRELRAVFKVAPNTNYTKLCVIPVV